MREKVEIGAGNRANLSGHELHILDQQVIPTARRWLRESPGLADHARQTLRHWGEYEEADDVFARTDRPRTSGSENTA